MKVTIHRGGRSREENTLDGQTWWTPSTLLCDLVDWLDSGKTWSDIVSNAARDDAAAALRALAEQIEATKTPLPEKGRRANHPETAAGSRCSYSPYYGTSSH